MKKDRPPGEKRRGRLRIYAEHDPIQLKGGK